MTAELDGYVTVYPPVDPAARVMANVATTVEGIVMSGYQPLCVRLNVFEYRVLLARNGLELRNVRATSAESLRVQVHGFDLPVDADARVPFDDAVVWAVHLGLGVA